MHHDIKYEYLETTAFPNGFERFPDLTDEIAGRQDNESPKTGDDPLRQQLWRVTPWLIR